MYTTTADQLLRPRDRAEALELDLLVAEGLLRRVIADCVVAADADDTPELRARAAGLLVPARLHEVGACVGETSALWALVGGAAPATLHVLLSRGRHRSAAPGLTVREVHLPEPDVVEIAGVRVTSPVRTAMDVARGACDPAAAARRLHGLRCTPDEVAERIAALRTGRGLRTARTVIELWRGLSSPCGP